MESVHTTNKKLKKNWKSKLNWKSQKSIVRPLGLCTIRLPLYPFSPRGWCLFYL